MTTFSDHTATTAFDAHTAHLTYLPVLEQWTITCDRCGQFTATAGTEEGARVAQRSHEAFWNRPFPEPTVSEPETIANAVPDDYPFRECYLCPELFTAGHPGYRYTETGDSSRDMQHVCGACRDRHAYKCAQCATYTDELTELQGRSYYSRDLGLICPVCREENGYRCYRCEGWFVELYDGENCEECAICECGECECGECFPNGCSDYHDDCGSSDDIHGYSYKPEPLFHHVIPGTLPATATVWDSRALPDTVYLGMELEVTISDRSGGARLVTDAAPELIYCKEDSSVQGFEIVTHPMTLDAARASIPFAALRTLRNDYEASGYKNGIHVHVSRAGFDSDIHVYRWMKLYYRNADAIKRIARRDSNEWASFADSDRREHKYTAEKSKGKRSGRRGVFTRRYSAINVENRDTFEVRVFRGSLRRDEIMASLELVDASVEYTRQLTTSDIMRRDGWGWAQFITWADAQGDKYRNLIELDSKTRPAVEAHNVPVPVRIGNAASDRLYSETTCTDACCAGETVGAF